MRATLPAPDATGIDVEHDELVQVSKEATRRTGRRPSPATIWRWIKKGSHGAKLPAVRVFGAWHTTREAFTQFIVAQTAAVTHDAAADDAPPVRSAATEAKLRAAGLL